MRAIDASANSRAVNSPFAIGSACDVASSHRMSSITTPYTVQMQSSMSAGAGLHVPENSAAHRHHVLPGAGPDCEREAAALRFLAPQLEQSPLRVQPFGRMRYFCPVAWPP